MSFSQSFPAPPAPPAKRPPASRAHMSVSGLSIGFNTPPGARSNFVDGLETAQRLPPYAPRNVFSVDDFSGHVPADWESNRFGVGPENVASYFAGVKAGQGMWFNFNPCESDTHHIAIVPSVQGVNPVTGKAASLDMQQYETVCPVHNTPFGHGRHCSECGYKWCKQNYVATTGTPRGQFWLDGFRQADGRVRQWLFTEEVDRGVAAHVLGASRGYSVAFAIYRSVAPKPAPIYRYATRGGYSDGLESFGGTSRSFSMRSSSSESANLEVSAGALISQFVHDDPNDLAFWNPNPVGIIMLYYAPEDVINEIATKGGLKHNEGPLTGIPVGN